LNTAFKQIGIGVLIVAGTLSAFAQESLRGHWKGNIEIPDQALGVEVDLDKSANNWIGSITIPAQNASGIPLEAITFANGKCEFRIKGSPGSPTFAGALSADGNAITGNFTQGPADFPFRLTRTGEPRVEVTKASPPVAKEFLGTWEGTLEAGQPLRLVLKISNDENGARGVLISVDQGGTEIPVSAIDQKESKLELAVKMVGGRYEAEINKDGTELNGTWTQGGNGLPLKLKKAAKP